MSRTQSSIFNRELCHSMRLTESDGSRCGSLKAAPVLCGNKHVLHSSGGGALMFLITLTVWCSKPHATADVFG